MCTASCYDMRSSNGWDFVTNPGEVTSARSHSSVRLRGGRVGVWDWWKVPRRGRAPRKGDAEGRDGRGEHISSAGGWSWGVS